MRIRLHCRLVIPEGKSGWDVYRVCGKGMRRGEPDMGNRVMETPNASGRTVPRYLIPRAVRLSRRRALRMAAKAQKIADSANAAKRAKLRKTAKPIEQTKRKQALPMTPRVEARARDAKPVKPAELMNRAEPLKPAEPPQRKRGRGRPLRAAAKAAKPSEQTQPSPQEQDADEAQREPLDYLQDGAIEWGIKRD